MRMIWRFSLFVAAVAIHSGSGGSWCRAQINLQQTTQLTRLSINSQLVAAPWGYTGNYEGDKLYDSTKTWFIKMTSTGHINLYHKTPVKNGFINTYMGTTNYGMPDLTAIDQWGAPVGNFYGVPQLRFDQNANIFTEVFIPFGNSQVYKSYINQWINYYYQYGLKYLYWKDNLIQASSNPYLSLKFQYPNSIQNPNSIPVLCESATGCTDVILDLNFAPDVSY